MSVIPGLAGGGKNAGAAADMNKVFEVLEKISTLAKQGGGKGPSFEEMLHLVQQLGGMENNTGRAQKSGS
jgi:hypothetical protein